MIQILETPISEEEKMDIKLSSIGTYQLGHKLILDSSTLEDTLKLTLNADGIQLMKTFPSSGESQEYQTIKFAILLKLFIMLKVLT